jgi:hypothetical protein
MGLKPKRNWGKHGARCMGRTFGVLWDDSLVREAVAASDDDVLKYRS